MKIRLKLLLIIFLFVLFYAFYYWGIPAIIDVPKRINSVETFAKENAGINLQIKNPKFKMGIIPAIWLDADSITVVDKNASPLDIKNFKIKIRLLPLIFKKINVAYFSCDKINADFKMDTQGRFYLGSHMLMKNANSLISIDKSKMNIQEYNIKFDDKANNKNILLNGDYFILKNFMQNKFISLSTNSSLNINGHKSLINADFDLNLPFDKFIFLNISTFDGKIINLNLADLSPYIEHFSGKKIKKASGILNIEASTKSLRLGGKQIKSQISADKLYLLFSNNQNAIFLKDKLYVNCLFKTFKNSMEITKLNFTSGRIKSNITGQINKLNTTNPHLNLKLKMGKSRTEDYINILPAVNIPGVDINIPALKKYGLYSDITGQVSMNGSLKKPKILGEINIENAYIIKPLPIPKAKAQINFKGNFLHIDVFVPTGNNQNITIKGNIELYNKKRIILDIKSTKNVSLKTAKTILDPAHEIFNFLIGPIPVMQLEGLGNIDLKTAGTKQNPILNGIFNFENATIALNNLNAKMENASGNLIFNADKIYFKTLKATMNNRPVKLTGKSDVYGNFNFDFAANTQQLSKLYEILKTSQLTAELKNAPWLSAYTAGNVNLKLKIKGQASNFEKIVLSKIDFSGNIKLLNNDFLVKDYKLLFKNAVGYINFNNFDTDFDILANLNKNKFRLKGKAKDNKIFSKIKLDDTAFNYRGIPVKVFSGNVELKGDSIILNKLNCMFDTMPIFFDGDITNIFSEPNFNVYINSKPSQNFIDKYINNKAIYPLIIKGDLNFAAKLTGVKKSFNAKTVVNLQEDSSIYYMGATVGDINTPIKIYINSNISPNLIKVNEFQYDKLITSQNNREFVSTQLNAKGNVIVNKKNIYLKDFFIKTQTPTDARVFNILFRKPMIKQGQFTSNIMVEGMLPRPKIIGESNFTGINIPFLDTTMHDIYLNFNKNNIEIKSKGEIFNNQIILFANMKNKFAPPFIINNADVYFGNLDVNEVMKTLNNLEVEANLNKLTNNNSDEIFTNILIKDANIKAKSVLVKKVFAQDLDAKLSLDSDKIFTIKDFRFKVAQGDVAGDLKHDLNNSKTNLILSVKNVNANEISDTLFDLPEQIYGSLIGQVDLSCSGINHKSCMQTLSGKGGFRVINGRMPKLGSLEYLLKAANLVKSGFTGLTVNSLAELVVPLKTGQFENINGLFSINSGVANDIQIFSKGKNLSLFVTGSYNFSSLIADMDVFGRISKKNYNVLGPVGNTSLNTLFNLIPGLDLDTTNNAEIIKNINKIPGVELNDKTYRIFSAKIHGDINGDNYVQSFKWVE